MKKFGLLLFVLFVIAFVSKSATAQSTVLSLGGSAAGICTGPVNITIDVANIPPATPLAGYDVRVSYDPASVSASAVFNNTFYNTSGAFIIRNAACGIDVDFGLPTCAFAVAKFGPSTVSGSGTLATITLTNAGPTPSTLDFYISGALTPKFSDPDGFAIPLTLGASVDIPGCPTGNDDFGDHLDTYDTLSSSSGPFHEVFPDTNSDQLPNTSNGSPAIWLGAKIDTESNGIPTANANGDDNNNLDDEDGAVPFQPQFWSAGTNTGRVDISFNSDVNTSNTAWLAVWFDWNNDGDFEEANELAVSKAVTWTSTGQVPVSQQINFDIPAPGVDQTKDLKYRVRLFDSTTAPANIGTGYGGGASNGEVEDHIITVAELPVSISYFKAQRVGSMVHFSWQTAMETGNAGFNIYAQIDSGLKKINETLIPSHDIHSMQPQEYEYAVSESDGNIFFIEDVSVRGQMRLHGPFSSDVVFGERIEADPIDWAGIRAEHELKENQRAAQNLAIGLGTPITNPHLQFDNNSLDRDNLKVEQVNDNLQINLIVDREGIYRLTYSDLLKAGFDLRGVKLERLTLLNQGHTVPIYYSGGRYFQPSSYIEFYGEPLDTIYTDENVYTLVIDRYLDNKIQTDYTSPTNRLPAKYYIETAMVDEETAYNPLAINGDPWIHREFRAYSTPLTWNFDINLDELYAGPSAPQGILSVGLWGASDFLSLPGPNHHIQTAFNGALVSDLTFKGVDDASFEIKLAGGLLKNGLNTLDFTQVTDTGANFNIVNLDYFSVAYPRKFVARDGGLTFEAKGDVFRVTGLPASQASVYRVVDGVPTRLAKIKSVKEKGFYSATFAGSQELAKYFVVTPSSLMKPMIESARPVVDIGVDDSAEYVIISHPDFISGLGELVAARVAQGFSVKVVNVEDIYAQFGYYIFDAQAIKDFITYAIENLGTTHVLLVGGDTYDYRGYLDSGGLSFIPSLYVNTDGDKYFAPVDPMYVDSDEDGIPNAAIGRFPVRNSEELAMMIEKTLAYQTNVSTAAGQGGYSGKGVFAADKGFGIASSSFISNMPAGWDVDTVYLDYLNISDARVQLINAINQGVAITSFVGHSGDVVWSGSNLLSAPTVATLTNYGLPTIVTQWGCWNTYFVEPSYNTMAHKFLVSGENGAAAVMGATTVSYASSERLLGDYMMPGMVQPNTTIGEALLAAKQQAAEESVSDLNDVLYGWTLLGDPGIVIQP